MKKIWGLMVILLFAAGCGSDHDSSTTLPENPENRLSYDFSVDAEGWSGGFSDYAEERQAIYELRFEHTTLPAPLDQTEGALLLSGNNHSDDLFMYLKHKIDGLEPGRSYALQFEVEFASNVADGMIGVGGSPGEGVIVKAGAVPYEPMAELDAQGWYRMNIDKGNQNNGGSDMAVIGDFSNDTPDNLYALKTVKSSEPFTAVANEKGELWVIVGTDSGFEATTTIYYNSISFTLTAL